MTSKCHWAGNTKFSGRQNLTSHCIFPCLLMGLSILHCLSLHHSQEDILNCPLGFLLVGLCLFRCLFVCLFSLIRHCYVYILGYCDKNILNKKNFKKEWKGLFGLIAPWYSLHIRQVNSMAAIVCKGGHIMTVVRKQMEMNPCSACFLTLM